MTDDAPQLLDQWGLPLRRTDDDQSQPVIPHVLQFNALFNTVAQTYSYRWDEAVKHLPENANAMRRDAYLQSLLQERALPTVNRKWQITPEDPENPEQKATAQILADIIKRTPHFHQMNLYLKSGALWFGRYGSQVTKVKADVKGYTRWVINAHKPVNGDKIQGAWDDTPVIYINPGSENRYPDDCIARTDRFMGLKLSRPSWREQFIISRHQVDDADYLEADMAGGVHGVGLRHWIYWSWWLRDEMLSWAIDFMKKVGTLGLLIFWYELGNKAAKAEAIDNSRRASRDVALVMGKPSGKENATWGVDQIPASSAGIETLKGMIQDYFEHHMERLIVGQTLSAGTEGSGLGGSGVAGMHTDTKYQLLKFDADVHGECLTTDLLRPLQTLNFPHDKSHYKFDILVPDPEAQTKIQTAQTITGMGVTIKTDDLRDLSGFAKPEEGDETVGGQQPGVGPDGQPPDEGGSETDPAMPPGGDGDGDYDPRRDGGDVPDAGPDDDEALDRAVDRRAKAARPETYALESTVELYQRQAFNRGEWTQTRTGSYRNTRTGRYLSAEEFNRRGSRPPTATQAPATTQQPAVQPNKKPPKPVDPRSAAPEHAPYQWVYKGKDEAGEHRWVHGERGTGFTGAEPEEVDEGTRSRWHQDRQRQLSQPAETTTASSVSGEDESKAVAGTVGHLFGQSSGVTTENLHKLFGSPDGLRVQAEANEDRTTLMLGLTHPDVETWSRELFFNDDGKLECHNDLFFAKPLAQGNGFGLKMFSQQVEAMSEAGVDVITTTAGKGNGMNGYYTWARMGYDAPLKSQTKQSLPPEFASAQTVQDLMALPGGRDWWKEHGVQMSMTFDLSPGSRSMEALNAYRSEKGLPPVHGGGAAPEEKQGRQDRQAQAKWTQDMHAQWNRRVQREHEDLDPHQVRDEATKQAMEAIDGGADPKAAWQKAYTETIRRHLADQDEPEEEEEKPAAAPAEEEDDLNLPDLPGTPDDEDHLGTLAELEDRFNSITAERQRIADESRQRDREFDKGAGVAPPAEKDEEVPPSLRRQPAAQGSSKPAGRRGFLGWLRNLLTGGRPSSYASTEVPDLYAKDDADGRWITIGAQEGEDGKKHGGFPVFIKGGRITKGHPSIIGKTPSEVFKKDAPADDKPKTRQQEEKEGRDYEVAKHVKAAKDAGIDPEHLHALADDILAHHKAHADEHNAVLKHARGYADRAAKDKPHQFESLNGLHVRSARGDLDRSKVRGFDVVATDTAAAFPGHLPEGDEGQALWDKLMEGNRKPVGKTDAYRQALDVLLEDQHNAKKKPKPAAADDDMIPFNAHAPAGGISIGGQQFTGGEFIPADVMAKATAQEKSKVSGGAKPEAAHNPLINPSTDEEIAAVAKIKAAGKKFFSDMVDDVDDLTKPEQFARYKKTLTDCLLWMTVPMVQRLMKTVGGATFYDTVAELTDAFLSGAERVNSAGQKRTIGGVWQASPADRVGTLHLDGGWSGSDSVTEMRDIYAHELGHAIDFRQIHSDSKDWVAAWREEICKPSVPLSKYATTSPSEGFAEFFRLLNTSYKEARTEFPLCWAAFKKWGYV